METRHIKNHQYFNKTWHWSTCKDPAIFSVRFTPYHRTSTKTKLSLDSCFSHLHLLFCQLSKYKGNVITVGWVASLIARHHAGLWCVLDFGEEHSDGTLIQLLYPSIQDWHAQNCICWGELERKKKVKRKNCWKLQRQWCQIWWNLLLEKKWLKDSGLGIF